MRIRWAIEGQGDGKTVYQTPDFIIGIHGAAMASLLNFDVG